MTQELITPNRQIAPHFVAAIVSFLRSSFGEQEYNNLRIADPTKKINANYSSVQFSSLSPGKEITSLWNFLQENYTGLVVENITPGVSDEKVTTIKISLDLPKEFLLEHGNDNVKDFCKESTSEDDDQNQAGGSTEESNQQDKQQGSEDDAQIPPNPSEESPEIEEEEISGFDDDDSIIKTVQELREAVAGVSDSRAKSRIVSTFFKWYLEQKGIKEYEVLPRTAYKYQRKEPEFVVRILVTGQVLVALETLQSQGCDVDTVGENKNAVRVKSLVVESDDLSSNQSRKDQSKSVIPAKLEKYQKSKNSSTKKKVTKKTVTKKASKKTQFQVDKRKSYAKPKTSSKPKTTPKFVIPKSKSITEIIMDFLQKDSPGEKDIANFKKIITFKQSELEILKRIGDSLDNLLNLRKKFDRSA